MYIASDCDCAYSCRNYLRDRGIPESFSICMSMNGIRIGLVLLIALFSANVQAWSGKGDTLFQVSTLGALLIGDYDGKASFREVKRHGDFGLGTFAALDGEMVAVDGAYYQVRVDGIATPVGDMQMTPFAAVTYFDADDTLHINAPTSCTELYALLQNRFPSQELLYAIKVKGRFTRLTTRSVPAQEKPYVPLAEALQQQVVFEFSNVDATLAGFWLPAVLNEVNVAGFHFHALTEDASAGGHMLDCEVGNVKVEIDFTNELQVKFDQHKRSQSRPGETLHDGRPAQLHW